MRIFSQIEHFFQNIFLKYSSLFEGNKRPAQFWFAIKLRSKTFGQRRERREEEKLLNLTNYHEFEEWEANRKPLNNNINNKSIDLESFLSIRQMNGHKR